MGRPLRIISLDGTRGAGKSSQIAALSKHFKALGMTVSTLQMTSGEPIQSGIVAVNFTEAFLDKHPNGLVILDGSIARPMVVDIISGMSTPNLIEKFKLLTHAYERIDHKYGVASFLMVMDDMNECERRIEKFNKLTGRDIPPIEDLTQECDIVSGMRFFNNHVSSKNIQFRVLDVDPRHSIMDIKEMILKILEEKYEFIKPKKDDNDW